MNKLLCICLFFGYSMQAVSAPQIIASNKEFIVDSVNIIDVAGGKEVSLNVFNNDYADAAVVVYDKDGNVVDAIQVSGKSDSVTGSIIGSFTGPIRSLGDNYDWRDARDSGLGGSPKTEINVIVPEGGRMEISKKNEFAYAFNGLSIALKLFENIGIIPNQKTIKGNQLKNLVDGLLHSGLLIKIQTGSLEVSDLWALADVYADFVINPENLDARKKIAGMLKPIFKAENLATTLKIANWATVVTTIGQKARDLYKYDKSNDLVEKVAFLPPSTCANTSNYVCSPTLGNVISGITSGSNSHIGSANIYTNWSNNNTNASSANPNNPTNTNNAQQQTGAQQSALVTNTQAFKSSDWVVTTGDAATHYSIGNSFGPITAPNGGAIAALNNEGMVQTVMQKTFIIPTGVKQVSVGMMANFVTNEFPVYVGSEFNDKAQIEIKTGSGNVYQATLYNKELNSANFTNVSGLPAPMDNIGGQTGFEKITKIIPVANGGNLTITVKTINVGDTAVPSATLINNTSVK